MTPPPARRHRFYGLLSPDDVTVRSGVIAGVGSGIEHDGTITDVDVKPGVRVQAWLSTVPAPGRDADEVGMDAITVSVTALTGRLLVMLTSHSGPITGPFRVDYLLYPAYAQEH